MPAALCQMRAEVVAVDLGYRPDLTTATVARLGAWRRLVGTMVVRMVASQAAAGWFGTACGPAVVNKGDGPRALLASRQRSA